MSPRFLRFVLSILTPLLIINQPILADDWKPISPEEIAMKTPKVEPNADAEAIFWEVRVDDSSEDLALKHYVRVKIFTERGREKFSKVDIPFSKGMRIKDIAARVIKSDGSIVELKKEDVFEREIVKVDDVKVKAKSFAIPNIEIGVIVEYRYREIISSSSANNMRLVFQRDIPIQQSVYFFKPISGAGVKYLQFNMSDQKFEKDKGGFFRMGLNNVPAIKEEPRMPPEDEVRSWGLLYYSSDDSVNESTYWSKVGGILAEVYDIKDAMKPGNDSKKLLPEIIAGANTPEEKLSKIFQYTRKLKNLSFDPSLTDEEKDKIKPNKSPEDTIKKGQGFAAEINDVFATLAIAAGFEARIAFTGDRSEIFFSRKHAHQSFIHRACVAVKFDTGWKYYDPAYPFLPEGMLAWFEENQDAFLLSAKDYVTTKTPLSGIDKSVATRSGKLKLSEDGTLEGVIKTEYTGHLAYRYRSNGYEDSATKREEDFTKELKDRMSTAEVSNLKIENFTDADKPLVYTYNIRIPNYAQKTGKRLFLQPGFFKYGEKPLFNSTNRSYDIYFHFPWSEQDKIEIELPKGFALDNADSPGNLSDADKIGSLTIDIKVDSENSLLFYDRKFHFANRMVFFQKSVYPAIKNMFDSFNKADSHTITLKQN
ncbi:MAG: DUF3857 and transglutaminase domain-containing protein [Acidobacteriota bacterium]